MDAVNADRAVGTHHLRTAAPFYGSLLMLSVFSTIFIPPLYANKLEAWLDLSEMEQTIFFGILDAFAFFSIPAGLLINRLGIRIAAITSSVLSLFGYVLLYVTSEVTAPAGLSTCLAFVAAATCGQAAILAVMISLKVVATTVAMADRGKGIGLLFTLYGLSGGFYTGMFHVFFQDDIQPWFFLLCGGTMSVGMLISSLLLKPASDEADAPKMDERSGKMTIILGCCIVTTLLVLVMPFLTGVALYVVAGVLVGGLALAALAALVLGLVLRATASTAVSVEAGSKPETVHQDGVEMVVAVKQVRYWVLWFQFAALAGAGMSTMNLLDAVIDAAQSSEVMQGTLQTGGLVWFSVGNVVSRFALGYLSDILLAFVDRISFMTMASAIMVTAMAVLSAVDAGSQWIYIPCFLSGLSFGIPWILVPAIELDWYGHKEFVSIHGVMYMGAVIGIVLFYNTLAIVTKDASSDTPYFLLWLVLAGLNACGFLGGLALRIQTALKRGLVDDAPPNTASTKIEKSEV